MSHSFFFLFQLFSSLFVLIQQISKISCLNCINGVASATQLIISTMCQTNLESISKTTWYLQFTWAHGSQKQPTWGKTRPWNVIAKKQISLFSVFLYKWCAAQCCIKLKRCVWVSPKAGHSEGGPQRHVWRPRVWIFAHVEGRHAICLRPYLTHQSPCKEPPPVWLHTVR